MKIQYLPTDDRDEETLPADTVLEREELIVLTASRTWQGGVVLWFGPLRVQLTKEERETLREKLNESRTG